MKIKGLQKTSLIDYPGKVVCTVFLAGCNFRCGFCYNKNLVLDSNKLETISEKEFFSFLDRRKGKLDGVVVCGGEPCLNGKELIGFISKIKEKGFLVKLDTNGSFPDVLKELIELVDYIAMDIKYSFDKYGKFEKSVRESVGLIISSGINHEFRTTVIPGVLNRESIINIANCLSSGKRYYLQQFRNKDCMDKDFEKIKPFSKEKLEEFARKCSLFIETKVRD